MMVRRVAAIAVLLSLPFIMTSAGCAENPAATAKCNTEKDTDKCSACCTANGAKGYKFVNGACGCLGK